MRASTLSLGTCLVLSPLVLAGLSQRLAAEERTVLPDEIMASGGEGAAQAHAGSALLTGQAAIHINPAMLFRHRTYDMGGTYFWPSVGRPFYRLSVVDGVTSTWTAAFEYTGFQNGLENRDSREPDSPVRRRGSFALAIPTQYFALGLAAHYTEAQDMREFDSDKNVDGVTLGVGLAFQLTPFVRFGASYQNMNNKDLEVVAPKTIRAGLAFDNGTLGMYADYRDRERTPYLEDVPLAFAGGPALLAETPPDLEEGRERMGFVGAQVKTFDVLKLFVAAGRNTGGERREILSGGLGIYQKNYSLSYALSRSSPDVKELQNSVNLSVTMKL